MENFDFAIVIQKILITSGDAIIYIFNNLIYINIILIFCLLYSIYFLLLNGKIMLKQETCYNNSDYKGVIYWNNKFLTKDRTGIFKPFMIYFTYNIGYPNIAFSYYMLGDIDKCIFYLQKIMPLEKQTVSELYAGHVDIETLLKANKKSLLHENSFCSIYQKVRLLFQIGKKNFIEKALVMMLILSFIYTVVEILNGTYITNAPGYYYLSRKQLLISLIMLFIFVAVPTLLILVVINVTKIYQSNNCSFFPNSYVQDYMDNEKKIQLVYILIIGSLFLVSLFFAVQATYWFWISIPSYISMISNSKMLYFILFIYLISIFFSILILSFSISFFCTLEDKWRMLFGRINNFVPIMHMPIFLSLASEVFILFSIFNRVAGSDFYLKDSILIVLIALVIHIVFVLFYYWKFVMVSNMLMANSSFKDNNYTKSKQKYKKIDSMLSSKFARSITIKHPGFFMNLYVSLGECSYQLNEKNEAFEYFIKALDNVEKANNTLDKWQVYFKMGILKEDFNEVEEAYDFYKKSIDSIEDLRELVKLPERKEVFFENKAEVYSRMVLLCLKLGKDIEAFEFAERAKGRIFLDLLGTAKIDLKADTEFLEKKDELIRKIRAIQSKLGERRSVERNTAKLNELLQQYDQLLLQIKEKDPEHYSLNKIEVLDIGEIQQMLQEDEVLIEFFAGEKVVVFLIQKNSFETIELSVSMDELSGNISNLRSMIENETSIETIKQLSSELYDELISPLKSIIGDKDLLIVPHRSLHYLPFNALFDGKNWLVEKYKVRFLQSASILKFLNKNKERMDSILVIGNPTEDLPSSEMEARRIAKLFDTEPYIGKDATKELVINISKDKDVIHLACHGSFEAGVPRFSRLLLADENLFVNEIYNLDLDASLVTLSACQTGLGSLTNGDEVEGMTRAFMRAGSPSVISSLWDVDDESTGILFSNFYQLEGNKADRLRLAQLSLMEEYEHPLYWAPFVIFGDK